MDKEEFLLRICGASRGRIPGDTGNRTMTKADGAKFEQKLELKSDLVSNTLTTVCKDNYIVEVREKKEHSKGRLAKHVMLGYTRDSKGKVTNHHELSAANTITTFSGGQWTTASYVLELREKE